MAQRDSATETIHHGRSPFSEGSFSFICPFRVEGFQNIDTATTCWGTVVAARPASAPEAKKKTVLAATIAISVL